MAALRFRQHALGIGLDVIPLRACRGELRGLDLVKVGVGRREVCERAPNPSLRALVSVASLSRMQTFIVSHLRSRLLVQHSSVSLCYWSVSLGEWKGNTLVLFLARGPMLDREAQ